MSSAVFLNAAEKHKVPTAQEASAQRKLSECGERVDALQKRIKNALISSYENFKYLKLSKPGILGVIDWKKRKITKLYRDLIENDLGSSDPELLCKNNELYYEEIQDAITGASRKSTPKGYLLNLQSKLNNLYDTLSVNRSSMRLDEVQFHKLLAEDVQPTYKSLLNEIEFQKAAFKKSNDP